MRPRRRTSPEQPKSPPDIVCYCKGERQLGELELNCMDCKRWFHSTCLKDLKEFYGLPFMVCYNFRCKDCAPEKRETWSLKQPNFSHMGLMALANMTYNHFKQLSEKEGGGEEKAVADFCQEQSKFFSLEAEIVPFFEANWESLTSTPRRVKNTWHATLQRTFSKESELFIVDPNDENAFALKERNLFTIGPLHEAVRQIGKKPLPSQTQQDQEKPADVAEGPKTRGASKRKTLETQNAPPPKKNKASASDFSSVQIDGLNSPVDFPFNREGYRYYLVEKDETIPNRAMFDQEDIATTKSIPSHIYRVVNNSIVTLSPNDRAHQLKLSDDRLTITGHEGYCVARATHGVAHGSWYFEVDFVAQPDESHIRIGWGQPYAVLQACLGYTKFSYSWRSRKGTKFHDAHGYRYMPGGYKQGDTLGCLIELPPLGDAVNDELTFSDFLPPSYKDLALIDFKHNLFFEEKEEIQQALKKLKVLRGSRIEFFRNGISCGVAFEDIYAGFYYPAVSLYRNATVRCNFGPRFKFPPPRLHQQQQSSAAPSLSRSKSAVASQNGNGSVREGDGQPPIRGMFERSVEINMEQALSDIVFYATNKDEIDRKTGEFFETG